MLIQLLIRIELILVSSIQLQMMEENTRND
jgi:hypothetical protein